jgi:DNA-binding MarR family transcriptional regulator
MATDARLDAETKLTEATVDAKADLRLWLRLLTCTTLIEGEIRRRLRKQFGETLPRFDLMAQLERAPRGLKMSELSQRMMVTGGNVTGITDGLEKDGLVVREVDPTDRRVFYVKLSAEGQRQFRRMAAEHEQWVIELFEGMSMKHKNQLVELLGELKQNIRT